MDYQYTWNKTVSRFRKQLNNKDLLSPFYGLT